MVGIFQMAAMEVMVVAVVVTPAGVVAPVVVVGAVAVVGGAVPALSTRTAAVGVDPPWGPGPLGRTAVQYHAALQVLSLSTVWVSTRQGCHHLQSCPWGLQLMP